jgi:hypothetical protein
MSLSDNARVRSLHPIEQATSNAGAREPRDPVEASTLVGAITVISDSIEALTERLIRVSDHLETAKGEFAGAGGKQIPSTVFQTNLSGRIGRLAAVVEELEQHVFAFNDF